MSSDRPTPPKSAPPGAKPRCERVQEMEGEPSARKNLETHLPLKRNKSPVSTPEMEVCVYYVASALLCSMCYSK